MCAYRRSPPYLATPAVEIQTVMQVAQPNAAWPEALRSVVPQTTVAGTKEEKARAMSRKKQGAVTAEELVRALPPSARRRAT